MTITSRITRLAIIILAFVMAACTPTGGGERIVSTEPQLGAVVPYGKPIKRDLAPITEVITNCAGVTSPVIKNPAIAVGSTNAVEWKVGGTVGAGVTIGEGIVPGGVNLHAALDGHVANSITTSAQQSQAWELPADPGMIMEYTIMWREVWQPAYIDVTFMDPEPEILRIDIAYRTGVQSEIIGEKATSCNPGQGAVQSQSAAKADTGAAQPQEQSSSAIAPLAILSIWGSNENGEIFRAERKGAYEIKYLGDAYSPWPSAQADGYRGWTTILRFYVNRAVEWGITDFGLPGPINEDGYLTPGSYYLDKNDAIASAGSDRRVVQLNAGEYITLIVLDEQGRYFDNQGKIDVEITYLGE